MTSSPPLESVRREARGLAASRAWRELATLLAPERGMAAGDAELALLYAEACMYCGEERAALGWLREVEPALAASGDRASHRRLVNMVGVAHVTLGELDEATAAFGRALDLATQADDLMIFAQATNNLGAIANQRGEHEEALWHYRLALPTLQRLGQPRRLAEGYHNMAISFRDLDQLEEADEHERRAIEYATDADDPRVAAMGRVGRAEVALLRGDARLAEMTARMVAEELERIGEPWHEADAHRVVGVASGVQGRLDDALAAFDSALRIARSRGHLLNEADTLRDRALLLLREGRRQLGETDARAAIEIFRRLGAVGQCEALERQLAAGGGAV
jgi:tetratricopeptide (TPR) repeat protein